MVSVGDGGISKPMVKEEVGDRGRESEKVVVGVVTRVHTMGEVGSFKLLSGSKSIQPRVKWGKCFGSLKLGDAHEI